LTHHRPHLIEIERRNLYGEKASKRNWKSTSFRYNNDEEVKRICKGIGIKVPCQTRRKKKGENNIESRGIQ
jgi:hypothetical protein